MFGQVRDAFLSKELTRSQKSALVNNSVARDTHGQMSLTPESPVVQSILSHTETTRGEQKAKGFTKTVMQAKLGGEAALQTALANGEINTVVERGVTYYFYNSIEISRATETKSSVRAQEQVGAPDETMQATRAFVENYNPSLCLQGLSISVAL